jgi:hypothetical protein
MMAEAKDGPAEGAEKDIKIIEGPEKPPELGVHPPSRPPHTTTMADEGPKDTRRKNVMLVAIGFVAVLVILAALTFSITFTNATVAASYPYTTTYDVVFPNSEVVKFGNVEIIAIPQEDRVTLSVNKVPQTIALYETKEISARRARISVFWITVMEFDFKLLAEYRGQVGQDARFYLSEKTSQQVPAFLVDRLLPGNIRAQPV